METYIKSLERKRKVCIIGAIVVPIILALIFGLNAEKIAQQNHSTSFIAASQSGVFFGLEASLVSTIVKITNLLKNKERLKVSYINRSDERIIAITKQASQTTIVFSMLFLAVGTIASGFFNQTVFLTLGLVLISTLVLYCSMIYFYGKKY